MQRLLRKGNQQSKRRWVDRSYELLDEKVASKLTEHSASVIHAYEDGAASSFQRAKELGIRRSYELPIAHWKTVRLLLSEEAERYPEWEPTLESTREPEEKLLRKEKELSLASSIICPSDFVWQSIPKEIRDKTPCKDIALRQSIFNTSRAQAKGLKKRTIQGFVRWLHESKEKVWLIFSRP